MAPRPSLVKHNPEVSAYLLPEKMSEVKIKHGIVSGDEIIQVEREANACFALEKQDANFKTIEWMVYFVGKEHGCDASMESVFKFMASKMINRPEMYPISQLSFYSCSGRPFQLNELVVIQNLKMSLEHNGRLGSVKEFLAERGRLKVKLLGNDKFLHVKEEHIRKATDEEIKTQLPPFFEKMKKEQIKEVLSVNDITFPSDADEAKLVELAVEAKLGPEPVKQQKVDDWFTIQGLFRYLKGPNPRILFRDCDASAIDAMGIIFNAGIAARHATDSNANAIEAFSFASSKATVKPRVFNFERMAEIAQHMSSFTFKTVYHESSTFTGDMHAFARALKDEHLVSVELGGLGVHEAYPVIMEALAARTNIQRVALDLPVAYETDPVTHSFHQVIGSPTLEALRIVFALDFGNGRIAALSPEMSTGKFKRIFESIQRAIRLWKISVVIVPLHFPIGEILRDSGFHRALRAVEVLETSQEPMSEYGLNQMRIIDAHMTLSLCERTQLFVRIMKEHARNTTGEKDLSIVHRIPAAHWREIFKYFDVKLAPETTMVHESDD
jgi:hypothetical protein